MTDDRDRLTRLNAEGNVAQYPVVLLQSSSAKTGIGRRARFRGSGCYSKTRRSSVPSISIRRDNTYLQLFAFFGCLFRRLRHGAIGEPDVVELDPSQSLRNFGNRR